MSSREHVLVALDGMHIARAYARMSQDRLVEDMIALSGISMALVG